jgi:hypothetical protein
MLIGFLILNHKKNFNIIKKLLNNDFDSIIIILNQFLHFQSKLKLLTDDTKNSINNIIVYINNNK